MGTVDQGTVQAPWWSIALGAVWALLLVPSLLMEGYVIFLFDAPGSEHNGVLLLLGASLFTLPFSLLVGAIAGGWEGCSAAGSRT
jgi:hypothetical protein